MLAATATPVRDGAGFVDAVRRSGLIGETQLDRALSKVSTDRSTAEDVARRFVSHGWLTAFQAKRLLAGKTDGFHLGPYVMLEPLGETGGGKVYRARHRAMNRIVAIKLLTPDRTRSDTLRTAFHEATHAAVKLLHPNIVATFDANQCGERMYAVLEFVPGRDLATFVREHSPLPVRTACALARQVALALAHAHECGIVHGQLNPDNVLVGEPDAAGNRTAKVLNFGFGRLATHYANDATRQLDGALAVAEYLAPETFDPDRPTTPATDLFSLGCLLHFLLTARSPCGDRPVHQFANRLGVEHWRPGLASELIELVTDLLAQDPARRPASARCVADRLDRLAHGRGGEELRFPGTAPFEKRSASAFADLETVPELAAIATAEFPNTIRKRRHAPWSAAGAYVLAGSVILATGAAIALVLRAVVR